MKRIIIRLANGAHWGNLVSRLVDLTVQEFERSPDWLSETGTHTLHWGDGMKTETRKTLTGLSITVYTGLDELEPTPPPG